MGMVCVCCSIAAVMGVFCVTMTSGRSATSSFANRCTKSALADAQRASIRMLRPSIHPSFWSPPWNAAKLACPSRSLSAYPISTPMRRIRTAEQWNWDRQAERLGGLEIDHELDLGLLLDRQLARLGTFEDFARVDANLAICIDETGVIAHQTARRDELASSIDCRNAMLRRQRHEPIASAVEEVIGADEERIGMPLDEGREGRVEIAFRAGVQDNNFSPKRACCCLYISLLGFGTRSGRVDEKGDQPSVRHDLAQELQAFWHKLNGEYAYARQVAIRPVEARDKADPHWIATGVEDDRDRCSRRLDRQRRNVAAGRSDHSHFTAHQVGCKSRQPVVMTVRPSILDRDILTLDITGLAQALAERGQF